MTDNGLMKTYQIDSLDVSYLAQLDLAELTTNEAQILQTAQSDGDSILTGLDYGLPQYATSLTHVFLTTAHDLLVKASAERALPYFGFATLSRDETINIITDFTKHVPTEQIPSLVLRLVKMMSLPSFVEGDHVSQKLNLQVACQIFDAKCVGESFLEDYGFEMSPNFVSNMALVFTAMEEGNITSRFAPELENRGTAQFAPLSAPNAAIKTGEMRIHPRAQIFDFVIAHESSHAAEYLLGQAVSNNSTETDSYLLEALYLTYTGQTALADKYYPEDKLTPQQATDKGKLTGMKALGLQYFQTPNARVNYYSYLLIEMNLERIVQPSFYAYARANALQKMGDPEYQNKIDYRQKVAAAYLDTAAFELADNMVRQFVADFSKNKHIPLAERIAYFQKRLEGEAVAARTNPDWSELTKKEHLDGIRISIATLNLYEYLMNYSDKKACDAYFADVYLPAIREPFLEETVY